jgi:hypothetical protein
MVLFGGVAGGQPQADTWTWDGTTWTAAKPGTSPSVRAFAGLATDPAGGLVLFSGQGPGGGLGDTWLWRSGSWTMTPT